ncbi:MAG: hypothetical protein AMS21_00550 [Gemmatimonas sp. SG8_38_2]|nr:MAG: hypothetical protein AMS21_00550 [Gemmatimonas sp. SG8_38_2]
MARNVLFLLGIGAIGWGLLCLFAGSIMPGWMGLSGPEQGELYIEALGLNVGLWPALGIFAIMGALFQRLRLAAALAFTVCAAGMAGGRIVALVQGAKPGVYTGLALALEVSIVVAASAAYVAEKRRLALEAKALKRAEKAALEAALAAEHRQHAEHPRPPSPVQQP